MLEIKANPDETISYTLLKAATESIKYSEPVKVIFNGITLLVTKDSKMHILLKEYFDKIQRHFEYERNYNMEQKYRWKVNIKGEKGSSSWEIAVIREDNKHGFESYGWFDERKLLISHNGGPCHWPIIGTVWDRQVELAYEICERLNNGEEDART